MKKSLFVLFLFIYSFSWGQNKSVDSLFKVYYDKKEQDTSRLKAVHALANIYLDNKPDTTIILAEQELKLALFTKQKKFQAKAFNIIGVAYDVKKDTSKVLEYYFKALKIREEIKDIEGIYQSYENIAGFYKTIDNYPKALNYLKKGLSLSETMNMPKKIGSFSYDIGFLYQEQAELTQGVAYLEKSLAFYQKTNDTVQIINGFVMLGNLNSELHNINKALEYFKRGISLCEVQKNKEGVRWIHLCIGAMYEDSKDFKNALSNYQKSLLMAEQMKEKFWISALLSNIGNVYFGLAEYDKALDYQSQGLRAAEEINDGSREDRIAFSSMCLARTYLKQKNYRKAKDLNNRSIAIAKKTGFVNVGGELLASQIDSSMGNGNGAYEHYKQYILFRDKLKNEEIKKSAAKEKFQEEYNNQKVLDKVEQAKLNAVARAQKRQQQVIIYSVAGVLLIVLVFSTLLYKRFRLTNKQKQIIEIKSKETEEQKNIIEEKNKDITDSITYAKRIQQAKLPKKEEIKFAFQNSFVLFKPKDIVSGDFYFFHKNKQSVFIAAADCTGHGVPGAFMSMIGSERLEDAVSNSNDTSEILQLLNKGIKTSLRQSDSDESTRDGMDIALCSVDIENRIVKYAGANRPIYIIRKGQTKVEEIKATKKAIGGLTDDNQHFDTHELKLQLGDTFYISTDGYADQFSGQDKKLTTKKFKQILLDIQDKTMQEQEIYLNNFIEDWKKGIEQIDDILVIGVRL